MKLLALDLGTKTGYARRAGSTLECGTLTLATEKELRGQRAERLDRRRDCRVERLFKWLTSQPVDALVFEDVQFSSTTMQTQLWAGLRSAVWLSPAPLVECCPVGTLKKFATGAGNATKEMMAAALAKSDRTFKLDKRGKVWHSNDVAIDDNAVDAVWLLRWAETAFRNKKP